jgi:hypothetical protein
MQKEKGSTTRAGLIAFIGVLAVLLVVVVVNIAGLSVSSTTAARQQTTLWRGDDAAISIDLSSAYELGEKRARQWSPDARLIRAEAAWRPTREGQKTNNPPVSWSLYYYSQQIGGLASVLVTGEQVFWVPSIDLNYAPKGIDSLPAYGVDVAWLTFRAAGGDDYLLRHKDAMINFRLHIKEGVLVWSVSAFDDRGKHSVVIDAQSGIVIQDVQN